MTYIISLLKNVVLLSFILLSLNHGHLQAATAGEKLAQTALNRTKNAVVYDPTYYQINYPNGDVPQDRGVCTDVVIRTFREALGIDLQRLVHEDMKAHFHKYPKIWGRKSPDKNIDHRRVPNLQVFFTRKGKKLLVSDNPKDYKPGDIVIWNLNPKGSLPHIGLVVNRKSNDGNRFLVVHNIGNGPECEDVLFAYTLTGHYRYKT